MAKYFKFNTILDENGTINTLSCPVDVFSANETKIAEWVSELNGEIENYNTVHFSSIESFAKFLERLSSLTLPGISKKR